MMKLVGLTQLERDNLYNNIAPHLDAIGRLFRNPKMTLIVRAPDLGDGDVVMSEDTLQEAMNALARAASTDPI